MMRYANAHDTPAAQFEKNYVLYAWGGRCTFCVYSCLSFTCRSDWRWAHTPKWQVWLLRGKRNRALLFLRQIIPAVQSLQSPLPWPLTPSSPTQPLLNNTEGCNRAGRAETVMLHVFTSLSWRFSKQRTISVHIKQAERTLGSQRAGTLPHS